MKFVLTGTLILAIVTWNVLALGQVKGMSQSPIDYAASITSVGNSARVVIFGKTEGVTFNELPKIIDTPLFSKSVIVLASKNPLILWDTGCAQVAMQPNQFKCIVDVKGTSADSLRTQLESNSVSVKFTLLPEGSFDSSPEIELAVLRANGIGLSDADGDNIPDIFDNCPKNTAYSIADINGDRSGNICEPLAPVESVAPTPPITVATVPINTPTAPPDVPQSTTPSAEEYGDSTTTVLPPTDMTMPTGGEGITGLDDEVGGWGFAGGGGCSIVYSSSANPIIFLIVGAILLPIIVARKS